MRHTPLELGHNRKCFHERTRREHGRQGAAVIPRDRRTVHERHETVQKDMLIGRQLPRDLRAQELARDVDFERSQAVEAIQGRVEFADELLVAFGQTIIPNEMGRLFRD